MSLGGSQCPTFTDSVYISVGIRELRQVDKTVVQAKWKTTSIARFRPDLAPLMLSEAQNKKRTPACAALHTIPTE
jgi:hypothetical protein